MNKEPLKKKTLMKNTNEENKKTKKRGITLIALIITIIVLLILLVVSVSIAVKTGLFNSAGKATQEWDEAQGKEKEVSKRKCSCI